MASALAVQHGNRRSLRINLRAKRQAHGIVDPDPGSLEVLPHLQRVVVQTEEHGVPAHVFGSRDVGGNAVIFEAVLQLRAGAEQVGPTQQDLDAVIGSGLIEVREVGQIENAVAGGGKVDDVRQQAVVVQPWNRRAVS